MTSVRWVLASLGLVLVLAPLGAGKPGLPPQLKADEPAYYLMALSLARDADVRCDPGDLARLQEEFLGWPVRNLILMTDDGWRTAFFGKPYVYSLLAAPAVALFGANGMVSLNMALFAAMIWMGAAHLARFNGAGLSALFSVGFLLLSWAFVYVFWLQPEVFNMAAVATSLFLGLGGVRRDSAGEPLGPGVAGGWRAVASGVAITLAAYNKPVLVALGLPVLAACLVERRARAAAAWLAGAAAGLLLLVAGSLALTGHASAYLGVERMGVSVESVERMPREPREPDPAASASKRNSWHWIFRVPDLRWSEIRESAGYFLWGRHTGLLLYGPFAALAAALFLVRRRRDAVRWTLLGSLAAVALFFLLWIPFNWHGGGGFVGNRYFVNAYPAFLFLVTRIPAWAPPVGYGAAGLLLGPLLLTAYGAAVPYPTLQAHARDLPVRLFPLELSLLHAIPGYRGAAQADVWFVGRRDLFHPGGEELWVRGPSRSEVWMVSRRPLESVVFLVRSPATGNRVALSLPGDAREITFDGGEGVQRVELVPSRATKVRTARGRKTWVYRLVVEAERGEPPPPRPDEEPVTFRVGAALTYLGTHEQLAADLYRARWREVEAPLTVEAGGRLTLRAVLENASDHPWPSGGATPVALAYHWREPDGEIVLWDGRRAPLPRDVQPEEAVEVRMEIEAPERPGRYRLVLDPLRERVAWFSQRHADSVWAAEVDVVPPREGG